MVLAALGIFGASLFLGDSMITPAISVLSAVEGLKVAAPSLEHLVVPITAAIIIVLFLVQRLGTGSVGRLFGPVMIVWFVVDRRLRHAAGSPTTRRSCKALSPTYAVDFFVNHFGTAFFALAAVVLAVTGAEALYADMGHFGRAPITRAWLILVFPACILSYMGQGALILDNPAQHQQPVLPARAQLGAVADGHPGHGGDGDRVAGGDHRSVLGRAPGGPARLPAAPAHHPHLRRRPIGQIYVPWINWLLMVSVLTLVFAFQSSAALAFAFGMAVTGTITITTLLFFYIVRHQWGRPLWLVVIGGGRAAHRRSAVPRREPDQARPRRLAAAAHRR